MFRTHDPYRRQQAEDRREAGEDEVLPHRLLGLRIIGANTLLDLRIDPACARCSTPRQRAGRQVTPHQASSPARRMSAPRRRVGEAGRVLRGRTLKLDHGIENEALTAFVIGGGKSTSSSSCRREGGTVEIDLRVGSSDIDESEAGWGCTAVNAAGHRITLHAPSVAPLAAIDGSTEAFRRTHPGGSRWSGRPADTARKPDEAFTRLQPRTLAPMTMAWPTARGTTDVVPGAAEQAEIARHESLVARRAAREAEGAGARSRRWSDKVNVRGKRERQHEQQRPKRRRRLLLALRLTEGYAATHQARDRRPPN